MLDVGCEKRPRCFGYGHEEEHGSDKGETFASSRKYTSGIILKPSSYRCNSPGYHILPAMIKERLGLPVREQGFRDRGIGSIVLGIRIRAHVLIRGRKSVCKKAANSCDGKRQKVATFRQERRQKGGEGLSQDDGSSCCVVIGRSASVSLLGVDGDRQQDKPGSNTEHWCLAGYEAAQARGMQMYEHFLQTPSRVEQRLWPRPSTSGDSILYHH